MSVHLSDSESLLVRAMADLERHWAGTGTAWRDKARADFEKEYIDEFRCSALAARQAMRSIQALLHQAIHECS